MAKQTIVLLTDDLLGDGTEAQQTVQFGLDGRTYTIDLTDKNAEALRTVFEPYINAGTLDRATTRATGRRTAAPIAASREQNRAIREWAVKNGHELNERGRIPGEIVEAFNKAHSR